VYKQEDFLLKILHRVPKGSNFEKKIDKK
jgi:hypothetical protein